MRILAVDDDPIILELLEQFIAVVGDHDLTKAESALDALSLLDRQDTDSFDCFLIDIQMPGMNGIDLTRKLRETARFSDTPILMLTAMSEKRYIDDAFSAGATDYVNKPFEVTELKSRLMSVEELVATRRSRTRKLFASDTLRVGHENRLAVFEPISVFDVDNVIDYIAMENYVTQLSRQSLFGSTTFAFSIRQITRFHEGLTDFEFYSLISDVAEVISDTLMGHQFLMSYAGNGTFVCVAESGWRPDTRHLMEAINTSLTHTELYNNEGQRLQPRVCAGVAIRLVWKSGNAVLDALAAAHSSAEDASASFSRAHRKYWEMGRTA